MDVMWDARLHILQVKGRLDYYWKDMKCLLYEYKSTHLKVWLLVPTCVSSCLEKKAAQRIEIQMSSKEKILNDNTFLVQRWHFHLHICPGDAAAAAAALPMHFNFLFFYHQHRSRKQQQTFWEIGAKNVGLKSCQLTLLQYRFSWWWTLTTHKQDASSFSILQSFRA